MVARDDELSLLKPDSAQLVSADRPASREAINNRSATDLMNTAFNDRDPRAAARRYVDVHTYIQHNPNFANGREAQIVGMEAMVNQFPPCSIEVRRTVAQGDLVVVQSLFKTAPDDRGTVVIDTFRFDRRGKIVDHGTRSSRWQRTARTPTRRSDPAGPGAPDLLAAARRTRRPGRSSLHVVP